MHKHYEHDSLISSLSNRNAYVVTSIDWTVFIVANIDGPYNILIKVNNQGIIMWILQGERVDSF